MCMCLCIQIVDLEVKAINCVITSSCMFGLIIITSDSLLYPCMHCRYGDPVHLDKEGRSLVTYALQKESLDCMKVQQIRSLIYIRYKHYNLSNDVPELLTALRRLYYNYIADKVRCSPPHTHTGVDIRPPHTPHIP